MVRQLNLVFRRGNAYAHGHRVNHLRSKYHKVRGTDEEKMNLISTAECLEVTL